MYQVTTKDCVFSPELAKFRNLENDLYQTMSDNLSSHNDPRDGFKLLEHNPEAYPFQRIDCIATNTPGGNSESIRTLAELIYPGAKEVIEYLKTERYDLMAHTADALHQGEIVNIITDHKAVIGLAVLGCSPIVAMEELNLIDADQYTSELMVSTMIKDATIIGVPILSATGMIINKTRFSIPSVNIKNREGVDDDLRDAFNKATKQDMLESESEARDTEKGILRMSAGSGSRDYSDRKRGKKRVIHMGPMAYGTEEFIQRGLCLPAGADIDDESPDFFYGSMRRPSIENIGGDEIMVSIGNGMQEETGIKRKYHPDRATFDELKK